MIILPLKVYLLALRVGFDAEVALTMPCIALYESAYNTQAHNTHNPGISEDHGLMQINDLWLLPGRACEGFNPYDPAEALMCARIIYRIQGLDAWYGYQKHRQQCDNFTL